MDGISDFFWLPSDAPAYPQLASQCAAINHESDILSSIAAGVAGGVVPGSSQASLYNAALIKKVQEEENLIATLSSIATSTPSAAGWVTVDINYLQNLITQDGQTLSADGGKLPTPAGGSQFFVAAASDQPGLSPLSQWQTIASALSLGTASTVISTDSAALAILSANPWGASTSAIDIAALSGIVIRDGPSSVAGADATAALTLYSQGIDPSSAIALLLNDEANPNIISSQGTVSGIGAVDRANNLVALAEYAAGSWADFDATLSIMATSSDPVIASLASTALEIAELPPGASAAYDAIAMMHDYIGGIPVATSSLLLSVEMQLDTMTWPYGAVSWTGSGFTSSHSVATGSLQAQAGFLT